MLRIESTAVPKSTVTDHFVEQEKFAPDRRFALRRYLMIQNFPFAFCQVPCNMSLTLLSTLNSTPITQIEGGKAVRVVPQIVMLEGPSCFGDV